MEKFAVDIDKVLDDFELDEDENQSTNQYDKLQLRFCASRAHSSTAGTLKNYLGTLRHNDGHQSNESNNASHVEPLNLNKQDSFPLDIEQPPGIRSPPDGQNDNSPPPALCRKSLLPSHSTVPFQPDSDSSQDATVGNVNSRGVSSSNMLNLQSNWSSNFSHHQWPDATVNLSGSESSTSTGATAAIVSKSEVSLNEDYSLALQSISQGQFVTSRQSSDCEQNLPHYVNGISDEERLDMQDVSVPLYNGEHCRSNSRPLDIVPEQLLPDMGLPLNSEVRHPDVIDIAQFNQNDSAYHESVGNREFSVGEHDSGEILHEEEVPSNVMPLNGGIGERCLLPDLMAVNGIDRHEGEHSEPAIVSENVFSGVHPNDPAIVVESQSCNRIPEVVNIHQTAESEGSLDLCQRLPSEELSQHCIASCSPPDLQPNNEETFDSGSFSNGDHMEPEAEIPSICLPPDVSVVSAPVSFNPDQGISDADLEAELEELEEEQERLHGAYNIALGSLHGHVTLEDSCDTHPGPSGVDLLGGTSSYLSRSQPSLQEDAQQSELSANEISSDSQSPGVSAVSEVLLDECDDDSCESSDTTGDSVLNEVPVESTGGSLVIGSTEAVHPENMNIGEVNGVTGEVGEASCGSQSAHELMPESVLPESSREGALVTGVYEDSGNPSWSLGAECSSLGEQNSLGHVAPFWIPDDDAPLCQECGVKFNVIRRRHHCRACGRVLCTPCCHFKAALPYMDYKEARVCQPCLQILNSGGASGSGTPSAPPLPGGVRAPNPNNPMEYCSRIPPPQQVSAGALNAPPPTVMVPVGVLKREGLNNNTRSRGSKQVMFSDGIRPGGDLTFDSGLPNPSPPFLKPARTLRRMQHSPGEFHLEESPDWSQLEEQLQGDGPPLVFAIHKNLSVLVKRIKLDCCVGLDVWNLTSRGLCNVSQEEIVVLLEVVPNETRPPKDLFSYFYSVYQQANQGHLVTELSHTIFTEPEGFLGSKDRGGFLYVRPTFQCLHHLVLPPPPYLFALLIQKWEAPWAKVFPLRLMLRLGAEFRYYPCPLVSMRNRKPVFCEIGHTIMNLLVDFRSYTYTVPLIKGFLIHMEDTRTSLYFPKNRYDQVSKALNDSNDNVLALGANFSPQADSHLVSIENDDGHYTTQAINVHNRPRKITGASFIVFNGALKSNSGLTAKSLIVEDGLMVQISADMLNRLRDALRNMKDFEIPCGPCSKEQPDETVCITWISDDKNFNIGVRSAIDDGLLDGVPSIKIHSGTDYASDSHFIRWTEVFIIQGEGQNTVNDLNLSRMMESLSRAFCVAVTPHLKDLFMLGQTRLALRATVHQDDVGYEAGSGGVRLSSKCMNDLDSELIPVIHQMAASVTDQPVILELLFYIME